MCVNHTQFRIMLLLQINSCVKITNVKMEVTNKVCTQIYRIS